MSMESWWVQRAGRGPRAGRGLWREGQGWRGHRPFLELGTFHALLGAAAQLRRGRAHAVQSMPCRACCTCKKLSGSMACAAPRCALQVGGCDIVEEMNQTGELKVRCSARCTLAACLCLLFEALRCVALPRRRVICILERGRPLSEAAVAQQGPARRQTARRTRAPTRPAPLCPVPPAGGAGSGRGEREGPTAAAAGAAGQGAAGDALHEGWVDCS